MFSRYLKAMAAIIKTEDATAKVYLKDVGMLVLALDCTPNCNDVTREPGRDPNTPLDQGDWWYTVGTHFQALGGQMDGFLADAPISIADDRWCWDVTNLASPMGRA